MSKPKCTDPEIIAQRLERRREQQRARNKKYYASNREKCIEYQKAHASKNPLKAQLATAKANAITRGLEFSITEDDLSVPATCPVLDIPISFRNSMADRDNSVSIDRLDSSKGYVPGNVYIISNRANRLKSDATITELEKIIEYMKAGK